MQNCKFPHLDAGLQVHLRSAKQVCEHYSDHVGMFDGN